MSSSAIPPAGAHGGDGAAIARALGIDPLQILDLSASLNPFAADIGPIAGQRACSLAVYPDPTVATACLADAIGVDPKRLILTNGGSEAITLVASLLGDGHVVEPEFSLYRRHLRTGDDPRFGRWRSNPSSPLGLLAEPDDDAAVWDEAFWPMTIGTWTRGDDRAWRLGSLTKLWACPGLRLGYVIAPSVDAARSIRDRQPRWAVNALALDLVPDLVAAENLPATAGRISSHRSMFADAAGALGFKVRAGIAPWLLLDRTPGLRHSLAEHGIAVRDCTSFGLPGTHRIALPRPADVDRVLTALASVSPHIRNSG